jgi:hypothetical protein
LEWISLGTMNARDVLFGFKCMVMAQRRFLFFSLIHVWYHGEDAIFSFRSRALVTGNCSRVTQDRQAVRGSTTSP